MNQSHRRTKYIRFGYYAAAICFAGGLATHAAAPPGSSPAGCCIQITCHNGTIVTDCIDPCSSSDVCSGSASPGSSQGDPCWADAECIPHP